jgi:hypothetical protein
MTWTDNRLVGGSPSQRSFAARVTNLFGEPSFLLGVDGSASIAACAGTPLPPVTMTVSSVAEYVEPVDLSIPALNMSVFGAGGFSVNPVVPAQPAATSVLQLDTQAAAVGGNYTLTVQGQAGVVPNQITKEFDLSVDIFEDVPAAPALQTPADDAVGVSVQPTLTWQAAAEAQSYLVELATDEAFTNIIYSDTVEQTMAAPPVLADNTVYFWRVTADNLCGTGLTSTVFSFKTAPAPGACDESVTALTVFEEDFTAGIGGFTTTGSTGGNWAISQARPSPASGGNAALAVDVITTSDQRLISPPIELPTGQSPITLQFWNDQSLEDQTGGTSCWDGGLLEVSTNNGTTWTQLPNAAMLTQPYTGPLGAGPASGAQAWCGDPAPYTRSIVDVDSFAGQTVRFRWRLSTDSSVGRVPHGWYVDDIRVQSCGIETVIFQDGFGD